MKADDRSNASTRPNSQPTDGLHDRPSARPPFPTVATAVGIKHGPAPKIQRFNGLKEPSHPGYTYFEIQDKIAHQHDKARRKGAFDTRSA